MRSVISTPSGAGGSATSFEYAYNEGNERVRTRLADGSFWVYDHDSKGQVISGRRLWADGTPVAGQQFTYLFDDIGNRDRSGSGASHQGHISLFDN